MAWISPVVVELKHLQELVNPYYANGLAHVAKIGKWPCHHTSTCQDGSMELYWIESPWACPCGPDGQMTTTLHIYRPTLYQWTKLGMLIRSVVAKVQHPQSSKSVYYACRYAYVAPIGRLPWWFTSTGQDSSNELDLACIGPVVVEFQCLQTLDGWTEGWAERLIL